MTRIGAALALALVTLSCGPHFVEGTKIEDTPTNRSILAVVEAYRVAVETRDVDLLARLVSEQYFEGAGTTGYSGDDYGLKAVLTKVLPMLQENIKEVFYTITVERIDVMGQSANVILEYELKFHYVEGDMDGWSSKKDKHRLDLVWEEEAWKISGGL